MIGLTKHAGSALNQFSVGCSMAPENFVHRCFNSNRWLCSLPQQAGFNGDKEVSMFVMFNAVLGISSTVQCTPPFFCQIRASLSQGNVDGNARSIWRGSVGGLLAKIAEVLQTCKSNSSC